LEKKILSQFDKVIRGGSTLLIRQGYRDYILGQEMAFATKIPYQFYPGVSLLKGRNVIPCVPIEGSRDRMVIKHYEHGGLFRKITRDAFFGNPRPFRELEILDQAHQRGVPVPEVIFARTERIFGPFYRGEISYKEIPDSTNLLEYLNRISEMPVEEKIAQKKKIIGPLAEAIKKMHCSGIYHGDLNIRNILLQNGIEGIRIYLIDFDYSKIKDKLALRERIKNLARLNRSCEKWKAPISSTDKLRFFLSYFRGDRLVESNLRKYVRQCSRFHWGHRIYWKLFG